MQYSLSNWPYHKTMDATPMRHSDTQRCFNVRLTSATLAQHLTSIGWEYLVCWESPTVNTCSGVSCFELPTAIQLVRFQCTLRVDYTLNCVGKVSQLKDDFLSWHQSYKPTFMLAYWICLGSVSRLQGSRGPGTDSVVKAARLVNLRLQVQTPLWHSCYMFLPC